MYLVVVLCLYVYMCILLCLFFCYDFKFQEILNVIVINKLGG